MKSIPACFFPTKVFLVDDEIKILKELKDTLHTTTSTYELFSNPHEVISRLQELHKKESYLHKWMDGGYHHIKEHDYAWREQLYCLERFTQVSTLIVDHTMPGLKGLDLCAEIQDPYTQKIMLTGDADESIAVRAFNEGILHGFVRKNDPKVFDILNTLIYKRQVEFFRALTQGAIEGAKEDACGTLLQTPEFINIFQDILTRFNIVEYYLMDAVGKFLLVDAAGNLSALYAYHEDEHQMSLPYMEADSYFENGKEFIFPPHPIEHPLSFLQDKVIGHIKGQEEEPYHSFPIYKVPDQEGYTWGYIPKLISLKKVISFNAYKETLK